MSYQFPNMKDEDADTLRDMDALGHRFGENYLPSIFDRKAHKPTDIKFWREYYMELFLRTGNFLALAKNAEQWEEGRKQRPDLRPSPNANLIGHPIVERVRKAHKRYGEKLIELNAALVAPTLRGKLTPVQVEVSNVASPAMNRIPVEEWSDAMCIVTDGEWLIRAPLREQAVRAFARFDMVDVIGIGFEKEVKEGYDLPATSSPMEIYRHIEANKGSLKRNEALNLIVAVQAAVIKFQSAAL